jgi:hypothetical protein
MTFQRVLRLHPEVQFRFPDHILGVWKGPLGVTRVSDPPQVIRMGMRNQDCVDLLRLDLGGREVLEQTACGWLWLYLSPGACVDEHEPIARIHGQHIHLERRFLRRLKVRRKDGIAFRFGRFRPERLRWKSNCSVAHDRELELSKTEPIESWHLTF